MQTEEMVLLGSALGALAFVARTLAEKSKIRVDTDDHSNIEASLLRLEKALDTTNKLLHQIDKDVAILKGSES